MTSSSKTAAAKDAPAEKSEQPQPEKRKTQAEIAEQLEANKTLSHDAGQSTYTDVTDKLPKTLAGPPPGRQVEQERGEPTEAS